MTIDKFEDCVNAWFNLEVVIFFVAFFFVMINAVPEMNLTHILLAIFFTMIGGMFLILALAPFFYMIAIAIATVIFSAKPAIRYVRNRLLSAVQPHPRKE